MPPPSKIAPWPPRNRRCRVTIEVVVGDVEHGRRRRLSEAVVSSWKLESSSTNTSGQRPSSGNMSSTASPMLPATTVASPRARHRRR
jgi:hypothetical protein